MPDESFQNHIYVVILCGGGGTRVWPLSINKKPKQFIKFYSDKTLFQETVARALTLTDINKIVIITNEKYLEEIKKEVPEIPLSNIIAEPMKKNTALAMGVAAAFVYENDQDGVIVNLASDHVITNQELCTKTYKTGAKIAFMQHKLIAIGITPTFAHPGLGYIEKGEQLQVVDELPISKVASFKEKPTVEVAQQFIDSGKYLWNANNYIWRADDILACFDELSPSIGKQIRLIQPLLLSQKQNEALNKYYPDTPEEPIDTAISEKTDNLYVLPGDFGWNDIGGWQVVYELGKKDENNNVTIKASDSADKLPIIFQQSEGNLIYSTKQPVAVLGLDNIVVVDTGIGLLVCDRKKSNDVKNIVTELQKKGYDNLV